MLVRLVYFALALWWGALTVIGFVVVPMLFAHLPSPQLAGNMAAKLFTAHSYIALACGSFLLMLSRSEKWDELRKFVQRVLPWLLFAMLLAALLEFAIAPRIVARDNLPLWHGLGTLAYFLEWVAVSVMLYKRGR